MSFRCKCLILLLSIAAVQGADKDDRFAPGPASSYEAKQKIGDVTIAAVVYETDEQAKPAFGKLNPYKHGVLPILVIIQNDSKEALRLDHMRVEYVRQDRQRIEATPANEVAYLNGPRRPTISSSPLPRLSRKKNPLAAWEIEGRAFAAKMLPAGDSAHGFFYFQTVHSPGAHLYLTGIEQASTGKELFYYEILLSSPAGR
jgi:hypothetical protein